VINDLVGIEIRSSVFKPNSFFNEWSATSIPSLICPRALNPSKALSIYKVFLLQFFFKMRCNLLLRHITGTNLFFEKDFPQSYSTNLLSPLAPPDIL
jgi:hypothetical protein